jgi:hypothetical protein
MPAAIKAVEATFACSCTKFRSDGRCLLPQGLFVTHPEPARLFIRSGALQVTHEWKTPKIE